MLVRIVKLTIQEENISSFEEIFSETKEIIRNQEGCLRLELFRDRKDPRIFFTYSHWVEEKDLQAYRDSEFFKNVWGQTREFFASKPEAWSLNRIDQLN